MSDIIKALAWMALLNRKKEPELHRNTLKQIIFLLDGVDKQCDIKLLRVASSTPPLDQMSCTYVVMYPGHSQWLGWKGDFDGFLEIYNPEDSQWKTPSSIKEMICEYTRFSWTGQTIKLEDGRTFEFPPVTHDDEIEEGYVTFRVST